MGESDLGEKDREDGWYHPIPAGQLGDCLDQVRFCHWWSDFESR